MLRISNIKISIDEDKSIIEKQLLKKLRIKQNDLIKSYINFINSLYNNF